MNQHQNVTAGHYSNSVSLPIKERRQLMIQHQNVTADHYSNSVSNVHIECNSVS